MSQCKTHDGAFPFTVPLAVAPNTCLQVLVNQIDIALQGTSSDAGVSLTVRLTNDAPTIRRREMRKELVRSIEGLHDGKPFPEIALPHERKLQQMYDGKSPYQLIPKEKFYYRYASGGTLPILQLDDQHYYCLFCRDVDPHGWNIANGSCDTLSELANPVEAIHREFQEELIVLQLSGTGHDITFCWDDERSPKEFARHVDFKQARHLWHQKLPQYNIAGLSKLDATLRVVPGPDSLHVEGDYASNVTRVFVSVSAKDYGIEVDKIAILELNKVAVETPNRGTLPYTLLDGEIIDSQLLNRPIGLFNVKRTKDLLTDDAHFPDVCFFDGVQYLSGSFNTVAELFGRYLANNNIRTPATLNEWKQLQHGQKYDLCPVTRTLINRFSKTRDYEVITSGLADRHADPF